MCLRGGVVGPRAETMESDMGGAKDLMMETEDLRRQARSFLVGIGTLDACEFHDFVYEGDRDLERAYRVANALITKGELDIGRHTRREFTDAIKYEVEQHIAEECGWCAKHRDED